MNIDVTIFLSRLIGIYCLVMFLSMLKRIMMMEIFRELSNSRALSYLLGVFTIFLGLFIVLRPKDWGNFPSIIITIFGLVALLVALVSLFSSKETISININKLDNKITYYSIAVGYFLVGAYLFYNGFFA